MSFGTELFSSSSYRRIFGESPRFSSSPSRPGMSGSYRSGTGGGYRSSSAASRSSGSSYRARSSRSMPLESLDLSLDLNQSSALNSEFRVVRTNEKEQMQGLNDRFAVFIEKVRNLEQHNRVLETELLALRNRQSEPSRLAELYQQELRDLRSQLEQLNGERAQLLLERDSADQEVQKLRSKYEDEFRAREEAEATLKVFKKDVDDATMVRLDLEKKVESLLDEISFLRKVHEEEVAELSDMVHAAQVSVEVEHAKPDLTSALKEIRGQYESMASKNLQSAEEWYKSKFADLSEAQTRSTEAVRAGREELNEYRRQLQSRTIEMESLRGTNESLERQIHEMEERHIQEISGYQDNMAELENELRSTKSEMARHLREYQDLLNVKMALDIEIAAYRKLLEGEETRIGTGISFPGASMASVGGQSYNYQSRGVYGVSGGSAKSSASKKESKGEELKSGGGKVTQREVYEETIVTTKKMEKQQDDVPINQKN